MWHHLYHSHQNMILLAALTPRASDSVARDTGVMTVLPSLESSRHQFLAPSLLLTFTARHVWSQCWRCSQVRGLVTTELLTAPAAEAAPGMTA